MKKRLLASTPLHKTEKNILFNLLKKDSQEYKDRNESVNKFIIYFSELYNKYLIPKELAKDIKNSKLGFVHYIKTIYISGNLFDMEPVYSSEDAKDNFSIITNSSFTLNSPLVDIRYLHNKDEKIIIKIDPCVILMEELNKEEKLFLKNLYCDYIENEWRAKNFLRQYYDPIECFSKIPTWDALYKLNPDWYDLLYNELTFHMQKSGNDHDLLSKTMFDREINETENINTLMRKLINYINE